MVKQNRLLLMKKINNKIHIINSVITMDKIEYSSRKLNSLKQTLIKSFEAINSSTNDPKYYYETIWDIIVKKSNIKEKFTNATLSKQIFLDNISTILRKTESNGESHILDNFLLELNNLYLEHLDIDKEQINIVIYTNIPVKLKNNVKLIETLKYFNLDIFEFSSYNFENENNLDDDIKNKFNCSKFLMLKYSHNARDYEFVKTEALNTVYSFFGYITYIHRFNYDTEKWHINEITLDHRITDLQINALIGTNSNFEIYDISIQYDILDTAIEMDKSKKINFNNRMPLEPTFLKNVFEINNEKVYAKLKDYFCLYYISALENTIENSFRKFWSLSERIIKDIHGKTLDESLVKYMERILNMRKCPDKIIQRVNFIRFKRNDLVHENIHGEITQSDQAIVKLIAESLILFLISYFDKIECIEDYTSFYNF